MRMAIVKKGFILIGFWFLAWAKVVNFLDIDGMEGPVVERCALTTRNTGQGMAGKVILEGSIINAPWPPLILEGERAIINEAALRGAGLPLINSRQNDDGW